jgi:hypothetical protein
MRIGLFASNSVLAEYFAIALGMADHTVTLYSAVQDLVAALTTAASMQEGASHEVLLFELNVDERGRQTLAGFSGLAKDLGLPIIGLTTASRDAIALAQAAFPAVYLRQLPLPLRDLHALIEALRLSVPSSTPTSPESVVTPGAGAHDHLGSLGDGRA